MDFHTPMMQQYMEMKAQYPDCILFFRLGDFYELFLEDAKIGSHVLGITLTRRARGKDGTIPMCGVPYHAIEMYIPRLVEAGYKIAIAEQISDPKDTPNLVIRKVIRVITAGTLLDGRSVNERESSFVCAACVQKKDVTLGFADIATGQFVITSVPIEQLVDVIHQYSPKEIILSPEQYNSPKLLGVFSLISHLNIAPFLEWSTWNDRADQALKDHFQVSSLLGFGLEAENEIAIAGVLLGYLTYTQQGNVTHIKSVDRINDSHFLSLDATTIESLELFRSTMDKSSEGSLFAVIDKTLTAMGTRLLKDWLIHPLAELKPINQRHTDALFFVQHPALLADVRKVMNEIVDIERLLAKLSVNIGNARDLVSLRDALERCEKVFELIKKYRWESFDMADLPGSTITATQLISQWILDDPRGITKEGGMIRPEADAELAELKRIFTDTTGWLAEFEIAERERTGIPTLKVGENSVFGFYIEVSKAHAVAIKTEHGYERKQTLVNAERYITAELKEKERIALTARESIFAREFHLFEHVVKQIIEKVSALQRVAHVIAQIDCVTSLSQLALEKKYVQPTMTSDRVMSIRNGRHPVVEHFLGNAFVPNSTDLTEQQRFLLLTGPNMAGKSTYIRQVALIVLLAHMGSFVPADHAIIPLSDRIFSRIGASDALHKGLSTFMVEMTETARILRNVTDRSVVIFDEIGRGTGTLDGMSIAQAIAEYVATLPTHPFIFFATHYHELAELAGKFSAIKNGSMAVSMHKGQVIFLRTLQEGSTDESYGIEVAKQAGIPSVVTRRADQIKREMKLVALRKIEMIDESDSQKFMGELLTLNLDDLTPKQAWKKLEEIQENKKT
ncbi:MAG: DNA mismatch repair protein MutS [Patescibacteria group bacterium]